MCFALAQGDESCVLPSALSFDPAENDGGLIWCIRVGSVLMFRQSQLGYSGLLGSPVFPQMVLVQDVVNFGVVGQGEIRSEMECLP
jgi:hypothetical protein